MQFCVQPTTDRFLDSAMIFASETTATSIHKITLTSLIVTTTEIKNTKKKIRKHGPPSAALKKDVNLEFSNMKSSKLLDDKNLLHL